MMTFSPKFWRSLAACAVALSIFWGVFIRFYAIGQNTFFFYDEGLYLNLHRKYLTLIDLVRPHTFHDIFGALGLCFRLALGEGKALWFFLSHLRVFFGGLEAWYFPRVLSAISGILTLGVIFFFARRFFRSERAGWMSVVLLALLPSHVFYSRLGLQETTCTLFFLSGFYFYFFPRKFGWQTFLSAGFFVLAYFLNYRLIILPLVVFFCEMFSASAQKEKPDFRKYVWHLLFFIFFVFFIGSLDRAQNTIVTFAWMFYQSQLAGERRDLFNFFSYPFYLFRLETFLVGVLFFANIYFLVKKEWGRALPFLLSCFYMLLFSFAADKAARYFCVMLPFVAMAVVSLAEHFWDEKRWGMLSRGGFLVTVFFLLIASGRVAQFHSDYEGSVKFLEGVAAEPKILTTQRWVQNLYTKEENVAEAPKEFMAFVMRYTEGYRYLILDPQAYVSWTADGRKFTSELKNYLEFIRLNLAPLKTFGHFNGQMLERFVFEHNENLRQSLSFLREAKTREAGSLRIYEMEHCIKAISLAIAGIKERTHDGR